LLTQSGLPRRPGLPKRQEVFLFFRIADDASQRQKFKEYLRNLIPDITSAKAVLDARARIREEKDKAAADDEASKLLPWSGVNIAFSSTGLAAVRYSTYYYMKDPCMV
jgi:hypothetical protein